MSHALTRAPNLKQQRHTSHVTPHVTHYKSPHAAQALPKRLWCVCNVEEHERFRALAAQTAGERERGGEVIERVSRMLRAAAAAAAHLSCSKCVSLLFLNGTCCCLEASALITSDSDEREELMATWCDNGVTKFHNCYIISRADARASQCRGALQFL